MLRNYFKIAFRNLWKHKTFALVNVIGMSVAFTSCLLLFLTAYHELSFDNFHTNKEHLYGLYQQSGKTDKSGMMATPLTPALKKEFPKEMAHISRVMSAGSGIRLGDKEFSKMVRFVDADYLSMFTFPTIKGAGAKTALKDLNDVVISQDAAQDLFGAAEAVGKTVLLRINENWQPFVVSAVVTDFPANSSLMFDVLARFETNPSYTQDKDRWGQNNHVVYVQLADGVEKTQAESMMRSFYKKYFSGTLQNLKRDGGQPDENGDLASLRLLPLSEVHFNTDLGGADAPAVKRSYPYVLLVIAGFIVLIACINFVNLSTARSLTRSREVGMRKVLGALKSQLVLQFWGEALIICALALLLGSLITFAVLPEYKKLFNSSTSLTYFQNPTVILILLSVFLFITLFAGGYPAWFMARFNTIQVLKGKVSLGRTGVLRNVLLVVQFGIATLLMICTLIAWQQITFLRNQPLGYNENQVVSIPVGFGGSNNGRQVLKLLRDRLEQQPQILSVSGSYKNFGRGLDGSSMTSIMGFDYKNRSVSTHWQIVDYDYLKTLDLKLVAGRDFSRAYATDTTTNVIINETMAKSLGEKNPIGVTFMADSAQGMLQVVGVVKDYHHESLKQKIQPNTLIMDQKWPLFYILVKIAPNNIPATMAVLKKEWETVVPNSEFKGSFLDENANRQYRNEEKLSKLFISAAVLAIVLSCMGLFAIAVMVMAQRTKEIGVRKVLGASVASIVTLLSKDFLKLVLVGIVIASPLAWYTMNEWLKEYAYKIDIEWWIFALAGLLAVGIAFLTVSFQSIKAALRNPVRALRSE
ncbi:ABC transporter permease [Tellurirhabdus bombi]|uniref:ABC transporter permease n=1 Tax=Tellurirhabdus bombi TaxID=2907205 RepID=UPI001F48F0E7|nr:ABC transporter permease [Tellurirhabdus bombi]